MKYAPKSLIESVRRHLSMAVAVAASIACWSAVSAPNAAQAAPVLLASDDFGTDHAFDLALNGNSVGFGWAADWTDQTGAGNYSGSAADNNGFVGNGNERTGRNLDTSGGGAFDGFLEGDDIGKDGTTIFIDFEMKEQPGIAAYYGFELHQDGDDDGFRMLQISTDGAGAGLNLVSQGQDAAITGSLDGVAHTYTLQIDFGAGNNDTASVFLDGSATAAATISGIDLAFDRISFATFNSAQFVDFDDIQVRGMINTAPEPSALILMGLGLVGLVARRRRRVRV